MELISVLISSAQGRKIREICKSLNHQHQELQKNLIKFTKFLRKCSKLQMNDWNRLSEIQDFANNWMWPYNNYCPHMALDDFTQMQHLANAA